jgi:hypothetical protein
MQNHVASLVSVEHDDLFNSRTSSGFCDQTLDITALLVFMRQAKCSLPSNIEEGRAERGDDPFRGGMLLLLEVARGEG